MINNNKSSFKQRLIKLLGGKPFTNHPIVNLVVANLHKKNEEDLPIFLKNYLSIVVTIYNQDSIVKKIIELLFDELIGLAKDNLATIQELYGLFNILSPQKFYKNPIILQKLYKSLTQQDANGCSGLYLILTKHKDTLLTRLINLAKNNPERIIDLYSAIPLYNKHHQSALTILSKEQSQTRFNQIKKLLKQSFFQNIINFFIPRQQIITNELNGIKSYCLNCLSTNIKAPPSIPERFNAHKHSNPLECSESQEHLNPTEQLPNFQATPPIDSQEEISSPEPSNSPGYLDEKERSNSQEQRSEQSSLDYSRERPNPETPLSSEQQQCSQIKEPSICQRTSDEIETLEKQLKHLKIPSANSLTDTFTSFCRKEKSTNPVTETTFSEVCHIPPSETKISWSSVVPEFPSLPGSTAIALSSQNSPPTQLSYISPKHLLRIGPL